MTINKPLNTAIAFLLFASAASITKAATDNTKIILSHTYTPYVELIGTAPGASRFYDNDELVNTIFPVPVNLGTLGLASNVSGDCDLDFSTQNNFELIHTVSPTTSLGKYSVLYKLHTFEANSDIPVTISCNTAPDDLNFILTASVTTVGQDFILASGVYRDVVTVTVTTQ